MKARPSSKRFTKEQTSQFRSKLNLRAKLLKETESDIENEALVGLSYEITDEISHVRTHPADLGSLEGDRDLDLTLAEGEIAEIQDVEDALIRIQNDRYGICEECAGEISLERLEALPYARYCAICERKVEHWQQQQIGHEAR